MSDQRGVIQEVSVITKKGVETKSYEGVSILNCFIILCSNNIFLFN